jgi:Fe-S cluster assembly protein SufD
MLQSLAQAAVGLSPQRRAALDRVLATGLPSQRSERWKYTSLRALAARQFSLGREATHAEAVGALLASIEGPRLVFVNGVFSPDLSTLAAMPGLSFGWQADWAETPTNAFQRADEVFAALNLALERGGMLVEVAEDACVETPVHAVFLGMPADSDLASHLRHRVVVGPRARLTLVEHHLSAGEHRHLDNHLLDIDLAEGAELVHARAQDAADGATLFARTDARLGAGAIYRRVDLELGAALSRHELNVELAGAGARFESSGALLAGGRRHVDTRLGVLHIGRDTACELLWRGLAAERGKLSFHGGIEIAAGADGSDASLSNKNLLLSANAEIDTQPVLQIHADEVKAAHGATVGRLDESSLFYLRARGIPLAQARVLLTLAFCREALSAIGDPVLAEMLSPRLEARLAALETLA